MRNCTMEMTPTEGLKGHGGLGVAKHGPKTPLPFLPWFGDKVAIPRLGLHLLFGDTADTLGGLHLDFNVAPLVVPGVIGRPESQRVLALELSSENFERRL